MGEPMPKSISAVGGKWYLKDNRDTPDTLTAHFEYPGNFVLTFESLTATSQSP